MPEFVLVPGAWLGGWAWRKVVPLLEEKGHSAYSVTLTGEGERVHLGTNDVGMETAVRDVLNVIKYNDLGDFVLVGHSFAGKVVASVADRVPEKVRMLLYVDAFRPDKNVRTPQGAFSPTEFGPLPTDGSPIPFREAILDVIGKDVKGADRESVLSKATPWPIKHATEPIVLSKNFDSIRDAYIFCRGGGDPVDEILAGKWGKIESPYKVIDSGHYPMITKPEGLVEEMLALVGD
jgi:pimeloyl-ACP methyl ester carboxylesterase